MKTDNDVKQRILEYAELKFFKKGFSRVTTDDIAHEVGISKRTLYENFANKEEILTELIFRLQNRLDKKTGEISERTDINLVEKSKLMMELYYSYILAVDKEFLEDIMKFSPKSLAKLDEMRRDSFDKIFYEMINKAIKEDLIRNDIPIDIIPLLFFAMQEIIVNRFAANSNYSFKEITQYLFLILTEGVITEKARNLFKEVK
jgi:TetR/AcrR family transcriptional regulator, cholesterol catabolism regulator